MSRRKSKRVVKRLGAKPRLRWLRSPRFWMAIVWLGTLAVVAYGLHELEPYARRIATPRTTLQWVDAPKWLDSKDWMHVLPELEAWVDLHPDTDLYDDRVCAYVAQQLRGSPWVSRVHRVSKQADGRVEVYLDFRKPFAMVERHGVAYLVDQSGVRLPDQWNAEHVNRNVWWVIQGAAETVPAVGEKWPGDDLTAGLKLAHFLYGAEAAGEVPFRKALRAIDVGNFAGRKSPRAGRLQLVTMDEQSYIYWGLCPGEEYGIESTAKLKLAMLRSLYEKHGGLPNRRTIDVRADDGIALGDPG